MEKEQNSETDENINKKTESSEAPKNNKEPKEEKKVKLSPEDKIKELEEKLARTLAEMENQRRRFEKEKDDAFEYGGFSFARESLNLIDNFDRAKQSLENDEKIKGFDALKKTNHGYNSELQVTDAIKTMIDCNEKIVAMRIKQKWFDIGTPQRYLDALNYSFKIQH